MRIINLTIAAELGIKALVVLSREDGPMTTGEITRAIGKGTSMAHVSKVMHRLKQYHLVESIRGPKGGYQPTSPADRVTASQVLRAIDGPLDRIPKGPQSRLDNMLTRMAAGALRNLQGHTIESLAKR